MIIIQKTFNIWSTLVFSRNPEKKTEKKTFKISVAITARKKKKKIFDIEGKKKHLFTGL